MDIDLYFPQRETDEDLRERLLQVAHSWTPDTLSTQSGDCLDSIAELYGLVRCGGEPVLVY